MCVCVACMCSCECMYKCMPELRCFPQLFSDFFLFGFGLFVSFLSRRTGCLLSSGDLPIVLPTPSAGVTSTGDYIQILCECWGSELRTSIFCGGHFAH